MNKAELISAVAEKSELTKKDAEKAVNALVSVITETLAKNEKVQLVGFGTFEVRERAERKAEILRQKRKSSFLLQSPSIQGGKALKESVQ